jgi:hypothetical protein
MMPNVPNNPNVSNVPNDYNGDKGDYAEASVFLWRHWFPQVRGRWFTAEEASRAGSIINGKKKLAIGAVLYHLANEKKNPDLRQDGKRYRLIEREFEEIRWWEADSKKKVNFKWMFSQEDDTNFGFEENIVVTPGDLIVLAGETNVGKTAMCLNLLAENMGWMDSVYVASEFNAIKFKSRIENFDWVDWKGEDGEPKFKLLKAYDHYEDIVREYKNSLIIIDWIKPPADIWLIGDIFRNIIKEIGNGVVVAALQKPKGRDEAFGKEWTMQEASVYLSLSYDDKAKHNVLKVMKVKSPGAVDPNGKRYSFWLRGGTKFCNITPVE